jgi:hypothetical protein
MPMAPPSDLVVGGVYRNARNPMYLALASTVLGQALILGSERLLLYVTDRPGGLEMIFNPSEAGLHSRRHRTFRNPTVNCEWPLWSGFNTSQAGAS